MLNEPFCHADSPTCQRLVPYGTLIYVVQEWFFEMASMPIKKQKLSHAIHSIGLSIVINVLKHFGEQFKYN